MSINPETDPYVCFRIRELKTFRKVRRSDTAALDKLRKLKEDLVKVYEMLDLVYQRECCRRETIAVEHLVFVKRIFLRGLKKHFSITAFDHLDASPETRLRKKTRLFEGYHISNKGTQRSFGSFPYARFKP